MIPVGQPHGDVVVLGVVQPICGPFLGEPARERSPSGEQRLVRHLERRTVGGLPGHEQSPLHERLEPLATSRLVIDNEWIPDLEPELWDGDEVTGALLRDRP